MTKIAGNTESDPKEPAGRPARLSAKYLGLTEVLAALLGILASVASSLVLSTVSNQFAPRIPTSFYIILAVVVGVFIVAFIAFTLYRRQTKQRKKRVDQLILFEAEFFEALKARTTDLITRGEG